MISVSCGNSSSFMDIRLASLGFGTVGRALVKMLDEKAAELELRHHLTFTFGGALTRTSAGWISTRGVTPGELAAGGWPAGGLPSGAEYWGGDSCDFAAGCPADIVLELTSLHPESGQPAIDHIRAALTAGRHVVTANKGPIAHAYPELRALANEHRVMLRFESTVLDGTPLFNMVESSLPVTAISGFRGLLNSTSNYILGRMASGDTLEIAARQAREAGIAEADPTLDLDGWDAAVKATILANVLMGRDLHPTDIERNGVGRVAMIAKHNALLPGQTLKQVVECRRSEKDDSVRASVQLEALPEADPLAHLSGMEAGLVLHTDTMQDLTIIEGKGGPGQTAFGILSDLVTIGHVKS
jgi:homoserine dehydrogenase